MKKRKIWIAALSALLVLALGIGLWSGGVFAPKEAKLSVPTERRTLPADPSAPKAEADEAAHALPLAATAAEQKPWTPPIQNLVTESIGAPSEEIPAEQLITEPADVTNPEILEDETVSYDGEHFLVKLVPESDGTVTPALAAAGVTALEPMMRLDNGAWFLAYVGEGDVNAVVEAARGAEGVLVAEYDFASQTMADMPMAESVVDCVRENPRVMEAWHLRACGIQEAWQYQAQNDLPVAGAGTIVAVIDTGVDYTHKELSASMWRNVNEIPDNNIDDDGNGYVDDYYGVDIVSGKGSGNDDHGHGTHVAGIIAAANNREGTVGVAYNAKIMNVKAGQSSGYFLQSDVAKAIVYAYENGADVINMSFGGTSSSLAVQDALATAYTRCVLVAAAGNDGAPNEPYPLYPTIPNYPAAFPYVLGVMSVNQNGAESGFTNWDVAAFNGVEYEVYAPGGQILSTIPGDRYAVWSGTSMAAPMVASVAAMLRADLPDRGSYPTKYIYGQIAGTGTFVPGCCHAASHNVPPVCDAIAALTTMPHPELGVSDYLIYDTEGFAEKNNGDGVIDAGETVALGFTLRNRWGMSKDTMVTVDALSPTGIPCPYVTFSTDVSDPGGDSAVVNYGSIGTYSEGDCGKLYSDTGDRITGWENPFYLHISPDCPNDYIISLNVTIHAKNALDESDAADYSSGTTLTLTVQRGVLLHGDVSEDMVLTKDNYYIVDNTLTILEGATVTVEPGTKIQFYGNEAEDAYAETPVVEIIVNGTLNMIGSESEPIELFPNETMPNYGVRIIGYNDEVNFKYCNITNPDLSGKRIENCNLISAARQYFRRYYSGGGVTRTECGDVDFLVIDGCSFRNFKGNLRLGADFGVFSDYHGLNRIVKNCIFYDTLVDFSAQFSTAHDVSVSNCVFLTPYGNSNTIGNIIFDLGTDTDLQAPIVTNVLYDASTRKTYVELNNLTEFSYEYVLQPAGVRFLEFQTEDEVDFLTQNGYSKVSVRVGQTVGGFVWIDYSEPITDVPSFITYKSGNSHNYYIDLQNRLMSTDGSDLKYLYEIPDTEEGQYTAENLQAEFNALADGVDGRLCFFRNAILNPLHDVTREHWTSIQGGGVLPNIYWGTTDVELIEKMIYDHDDYASLSDVDPSGFLTEAPEDVWPFVTDVEIFNQAGEQVTTVGNEPLTFVVHFNRDMDTSIDLSVKFGSYYPYADYEIEGVWQDARTWEGSTTLTTLIENGTQYLRIGNGHAADAPMKLYDDYGRFIFTIDTTAAQAMIMQGAADDNGILLTWYQDDFDTLAGYNVYRSTSEDGFYQRLNSSVIPADVKEFYDDTVEPGKVYYYNFTVVKTDITESTPSGKVTIMSKDTMAPVMYHTPVYQAFTGTNLIINATVTDNVAVQSVKLYFRQTGETEWNVTEMNKLNDKYSAVISSALVTTQGLEYYIEAFDGVQRVYRGTAEAPYAVTVQEAVDLTDKGDVNGDGRITNLDALMLLQAVNDRLNLDAAQFARADINDNGELEAVEALRILHYVSGKVTSILF